MQRKGWFKKAKMKFVIERVFVWGISNGDIYLPYSLKMFHPMNEEDYEFNYFNKDNIYYQTLLKIRKLGFIKGFWEARRVAKKLSDKGWYFYYVKKETL